MKKQLLFGTLCFICFGSLSQEVVSTQGDSYSGPGGSVDFTVGEVVIFTGTNGTNDVTQGFHQTNWNFAGLEDHQPGHAALIYPNPTSDQLIINMEGHDNVTFLMTDAAGKIVREGALTGQETMVDVADVAPGNYAVSLINNEVYLKTFKLIKN